MFRFDVGKSIKYLIENLSSKKLEKCEVKAKLGTKKKKKKKEEILSHDNKWWQFI